MKLLTTNNPKTAKGEQHGYLTAILHLAPSKLASVAVGKVIDVCPWSSPGCREGCLYSAGRAGIMKKGENSNVIMRARIERTRMFFSARAAFMRQLKREIGNHATLAEKHDLSPTVRLNGTSDLPWEAIAPELFYSFPEIDYYDYTKAMHRAASNDLPDNYSLTFSRSETNESDAIEVLLSGGNVAIVFEVVPETWNGFKVINGDENDLRFKDPRGVVVGLKAKGKAKRDASGFVVRELVGAV